MANLDAKEQALTHRGSTHATCQEHVGSACFLFALSPGTRVCVCNGSIVLALGAPKEAAISEATVLAPSFARAHQALTASLRKTQPLAQTRPAAKQDATCCWSCNMGRANAKQIHRNKCSKTAARSVRACGHVYCRARMLENPALCLHRRHPNHSLGFVAKHGSTSQCIRAGEWVWLCFVCSLRPNGFTHCQAVCH